MAIELTPPPYDLSLHWDEIAYGTRFHGFQNLMQRRVRDLLLVSSLFDRYLFEEDGKLYEHIRSDYQAFRLSHSPEIIRVSAGEDAITRARETPFDLIITTPHIEDMDAVAFARKVRAEGLDIPVVLLAYDTTELLDIQANVDLSVFDRVFVWQGDYRLLIAIISDLEDRLNVDHDSAAEGVQSIVLIEDSVSFYSTFLPLVYTEVMNQTQRLISEGLNFSHKYLRMRARPKILLCSTYEEAWHYFEKYGDTLLGVISDVEFRKNGVVDPKAGIAFAREVKSSYEDIPILLHSYNPEHRDEAHGLGASFILKDSPRLLDDVREFMFRYFSFGDFAFCSPDGTEIMRASDLRSMIAALGTVPDESIRFHGERNHFSNWLKARTEFWLAYKLRPHRVSDYPDARSLRSYLISALEEYLRMRQQGLITDFSRDTFDPTSTVGRIGSGSVGGKARGLGFVNMLMSNYGISSRFPGVRVYVPPGVIVATDVFDQYLEQNGLRHFALNTVDDDEIVRAFMTAAVFPLHAREQLAGFLDRIHEPLAVRSSSLLEDSQYHPFAGIYETIMIPNNHPDHEVRLNELLAAIRRVYASTYSRAARDYIRHTTYRIEEEKMAVIIQSMAGARHGNRFYPEFSGVARSHNFYPAGPQKPEDGIVAMAVGLGKTIVEGGMAVRFSPRYPYHLPQFSNAKQSLLHNQVEFYALRLDGSLENEGDIRDRHMIQCPVSSCESDGTLAPLVSTYSPDNDTLHEGMSRSGIRVVTFSPILHGNLFPVADILNQLLALGSWGMGSPVEMEFAVNLTTTDDAPREFAVLQMRPFAISRETDIPDLDNVDRRDVLCVSHQVLGHGIARNIHDMLVIDIRSFDRSRSRDVAQEIGVLNERLTSSGTPYLLIGIGRWGSLDPWLGIPVKWDQISGARAIVEADFQDMQVTPSQGSHFFHNIISLNVGYFTVSQKEDQDFVDWRWLMSQEPVEKLTHVRRLTFSNPVVIKMNGKKNQGVILKPETGRVQDGASGGGSVP